MTWYNDDPENAFIDATQEFTGGGASTSVSQVEKAEDLIIEETTPDTEEETTIGNVLLPAVFNEQTGTFDLYIRNTNQGGRIFLTTRGDSEKVKIEDGLLYIYYDYDFFNAPAILGGWTNIVKYLVTTRQIANVNSTAVAAAAGLATSAKSDAATAFGLATSAQSLATTAEGTASTANTTALLAKGQAETNTTRIFRLESRSSFEAPLTPAPTPSVAAATNNPIRNQAFQFGEQASTAAAIGGRAVVSGQRAAQLLTRGQIFLNIISAVIGAGLLGSAISLLGLLLDYTKKQQLDSDLIELLKDMEQNAQSYNSVTQDHIHKTGLQIVSSTNGNFTTAGLYLIELTNETFLNIEISGSPLTAKIDSVSGGKTTLLVNDVISIPKADLGGSVSGVGDLEITITSLITELASYDAFLQDKINQGQNIENRQRRRQNIPTSSSFNSDGFNITNTQITEPITSEITNEPTISLKLDTSQFSYDASGNLQLVNHANIGYTGNLGIPSDPSATPPVLATQLNLAVENNTANIGSISADISTLQTSLGVASDPSANPAVTATGLHAIVEQNVVDIAAVTGGININQLQQDVIQNTTDLTALETVVGTLPIYDSDGNPVIISTGVFERLDNVYKIIMPEGFTYDNNDEYKLNLGYFTPWDDYKYDLICVALKGSRAGAFDSSFYGGDYLGFMPSLTRMIDTPNIEPVKDIGLQFTNDMFFRRGLVFLELSDPLVDYDLNRKLEFICFVKPTSVDNAGVEYTLLQTGIEFVNGDYELDTSKLKLAIRDNKLEVTHTVLASYDYWQPFPNRNFNNASSFIARGGNGFGEKTSEFSYSNPAGHQQTWRVKDQQVYLNNVIFESRARVVLDNDTNTMQYYDSINQNHVDLNINLLETNSSGTHASPVICYSENLAIDGTTRNNMAKIKIAFEYMQCSTAGNYNFYGNTLQFKTFTSLAQLNNELEFKWRISVGFTVAGNPPNIQLTRDYDFDQIEYAPQSVVTPAYYGERFYMQELWMPTALYPGLNGSPGYIQNYYNYIEVKLVHRGGTFTAPLSGTQPTEFFAGQHNIRVYGLNFFEYKFNQDTYNNYTPYTEVGSDDIFPSGYDPNLWYKLIFEIDLANRDVFYYVNNTPYSTFQYESSFINVPHATINFPNSDPTIIYVYDATYQIVNNGDSGLIRNNNILVVGNEPASGELQFSHFNFTFFQQPTPITMTSAERLKLDNLIKYNYYYETVEIPRYLKVKEFYADVFDARRVLINGGFAYDELTPAQQLNSIRSSDISTDNLSTLNAFVNIDKLFVTDQTTSGSLDYNHTTKEFEIILRNNFEPLLYYDKTNTDLLFTSKIQFTDHFTPFNIFNSTFSRFELIDTEIELVDGDITYLYQHRERDTPGDPSLEIVTYFFNCVNNTNISDATVRRFLYRDLITNVMPPLLGSTTNISPICSYDFNNNFTNKSGTNAFDLVETTQISVVYGDPNTNQKSVSGLAGGSSVLEHPALYNFTTHNTISFIHRPIQLASHGVINFKRNDGQDTIIIAGIVQGANFNYLLFLTNPNGGAQTFIFNNPNNDTFLDNDNAIVLYNIDTNYFWYINGAFHGLITVTWSPIQIIEPSKLHLDLNNTLDANGILYDLKLYNAPLFEYPASTAEQQLFNKKRLIDITQFTRITDDADGNFILKELTPYKTIKANSLKSGSAVTEKSVTTISSRRTIQEADVFKKVSETEKYQVFDTEVEVNGNLLLENVNNDVGAFFTIYTATQKQTAAGVNNFKDTSSIILDDSTNEWIFSRLPETANLTTSTTKFKHDTTDLLILKHNEVECSVGLKVGTITFADNTTLTSFVDIQNEVIALGNSLNQAFNTNLASQVLVLQNQITQNATNIGTNTSNLTALNNNISTTHPSWIEFAKDLKLPNGDVISSLYDDVDVRTLLSTSAGTNLTWNNTNNQFDVTLVGFSGNYNDLTNKPNLSGIATNTTNIATNAGNIATNTTNIATNAGNIATNTTNIATNTTNIATNTSDLVALNNNISTTHPSWIEFAKDLKLPNGDVISSLYDDVDVRTLLSTSAGTNLTWNNTNNQFDVTGGGYTDTDARSAVYPINQVNTGLPLISSGINLFDTDLWFNSTDSQRRLQFENNSDTIIHCPSGISNKIRFQHNGSERFSTGETLNKSSVSMQLGPSPYNTSPLRFAMIGANNRDVSSVIVFADSGSYPYYTGMMIYYDSQFNKLKISADLDDDGNIDLEPAVTIQRDDRYVGILNSMPDYPLDVTGDIQTSTTIRTPRIDFGDGTNLTTASGIATNTTDIATNTTNIATNTTNIATNTTNIATNTTNIATNTTNIATNTTDIATNTTNIATNTTDIATNTTNIATNTTNIATNTTDIATNTTDIATNTTDIATNTTNIATNTTNIATNAGNIATNTSDLVALNNNISTTHPSYIEFAKDLKLPNGDVISSVYDDTDVRTVLASSAGTNLTWNNTNNQFDVTGGGGGFSGNYNDLTNLPTLFSENYNDLTNKPNLAPVATSGSYNSLYNLPSLAPVATTNSYNSLYNLPTIPTIPSYLFAPTFLKVYFLLDFSAIMTQLTEPGAIAPYINSTNIPINVGNFSVTSSGISVPANGYYHIDYCMLMRSRYHGYDRKNIITSIKVNNADPDGRLQGVGGSYMRFRANSSENCENAQSGNTLLYLETTDVVSVWGYREGATGDVFITRGGNMQVRRIA